MKRSDWQGENDGLQRLPLAWQGGGPTGPPGKIGRGFLASSHAGTRLPIAASLARTQGAPPRSAPGYGRGAMVVCAPPLFPKCTKKQRTPWGTAELEQPDDFLRWHDPHQVKGSKQQLPLSRGRLPCFSLYYGIKRKKCQEEGCKTDKRGVS